MERQLFTFIALCAWSHCDPSKYQQLMLNLLPNSQSPSPHSRSPLDTGLLRVPFFISPLNCLHSSPSLTASKSSLSESPRVPGVEEAMNKAARPQPGPGIVVTVTRESLLVLTLQCLVKEGRRCIEAICTSRSNIEMCCVSET